MTTLSPQRQLGQHARLDPVPDVTDRCLAGLRQAMNDETALFDRQIRDRSWSSTHGTEDITSTCICLIGLHRAGVDPAELGIGVTATLEALVDRALNDVYVGSIGLVTWATSLWWDHVPASSRTRLADHRTRYAQFLPVLTTMEAAWLVSGLVHAKINGVLETDDAITGLARTELHGRVGEGSLMMHAGRGAGLRHRVRRHVANFADQIYSVQAMSFLAVQDHDRASLDLAGQAADRLVELQGAKGQWWWHYDGRDGSVLRPYPVYSVHQLGMAPMSLLALHASDNRERWTDATERSRTWLIDNELGVNMVGDDTIWRDQRPTESRLATIGRHVRSIIGVPGAEIVQPRTDLEINYETRPYEWAWYLYAEAIRNGVEREGHVV